MKEEVVAVVLLLWKAYLCDAENVIVGSTKQLICQIQNGNRWEKYSDESALWETINNGGRYSGSNSSILTITNFQIEDSGNFRCKVDGTVSYGANIKLNPEVLTVIDSTLAITCTVAGMPLYWYIINKNTGIRTLIDNHKYEGSTTKVLRIKSVTKDDATIYYCQSFNSALKGPDITVSISDWSTWRAWSDCNVACGTGQRQRTRICSGSCLGDTVETEQCTVDDKVDGGWSSWDTSAPCTESCGTGIQKWIRFCNNPSPTNCGAYCKGNDNDYTLCSLSACPVDGGWSSWFSVGTCPVTCGTGLQSRTRYCNNPAPANSGAYCQGEIYDNISCTLSACPVNEGWSTWNSWGACTVTCGTGQQRRRRDCNNPLQANGGVSCQGEEYDFLSCSLSECAEQQSGNISITVGTVIGVLVVVILILILVIYAKRRWYNSKKEPAYEITDMRRVKDHIYGETHVNRTYQNDPQSAEIEVTAAENYIDEAHLIERYDVSDLTKRYRNKEYFLQSLRSEFKLLNYSTDDPKPLNSQYEIVNTGLKQDVNQLNLNSSTLNVLYNNKVSIWLEVPEKNLAEQFWTIVDDHCIENIILLVKENEKVTEFYPTIDDIFRMNNFEIYLDSSERKNKNIKLLTFNLENKRTQSMRQVKIFKANVWESPHVKGTCCILDKASEMRGAPVLIINSKMADLSVCGVLSVCLNVIYAIKSGSPFSVLENARMVNKNNRSFFKNFDDYELCYKVIKHYLEDVHTYDVIE